MKVKIVPCLFFLLNTFLFATYYSVSKEALGRIEPIIFSFCEMVTLLPVGICILIMTRKDMSKVVIKRGVILGSLLCLALFTIAIALKYTTATSTAFFPSLNGLLAALIAWLFFRQPSGKVTWFAGTISVLGTVLLI
ncbi:MAG: DMT family transporter, partial [Chloroflexota bacterium]|nr:DMT family transporter [Chloroflexota bacterium]